MTERRSKSGWEGGRVGKREREVGKGEDWREREEDWERSDSHTLFTPFQIHVCGLSNPHHCLILQHNHTSSKSTLISLLAA